ncbi:DISARM system-associated protein DrmE, partial [Planomicrobium sp. MB-3u-38]|uniref:DISARM system-associated protein DrmE n=1 Tax=Planomicrobium sp. MB-3u-38 TaxID=2058318 RepID=UPI000CB66388
DYNQETVKDMLKELIESEHRFENTDFENLIEIIEDIYNKYNLDRESPKYLEIEKWIEKGLKRESSMLILIDGKIETIGLREKLAMKFNVDISELKNINIEVASYQNALLMNENNYDEVLLTSLINIKDFNILEKRMYKKVDIILYEIELREIKKTLNTLREVKNRLIDTGVSSEEENIYTKLYSKFRSADSDRGAMASLSITDVSNSILSLPNSYSHRLKKPYKGNNAVTAKLVVFEDEFCTFLKLTDNVNVRKEGRSKAETKVMADLEEGDDLILIDGDVRQDLYNIFIKNVNSGNTSKKHYEVVKKWRELYEDKFVYLKLDDNELFTLMKLNGWNKTSKGILGNWRTGYSYGPRDQEDIIILGLSLNITEFIKNQEYYFNSMRYIRTEARVAARLLNKIIYYTEKKINSNDNAFLNKYQLTIEEVQSAVHIKKVKHISIEEYSVKPTEIGEIFNQKEEIE